MIAKPRLVIATACMVILAGKPTVSNADTGESKPDQRPPNILFLLVDDWGWTDAGCLGSDLYQTPNIDQFQRESVNFDNGYSACTVCSPTRGALMTGKYPARTHLTNYIPGARQPDGPLRNPDWTKRLEHRHVTIAEVLRKAGYHTAHLGKWHLTPFNDDEVDAYLPEKHGFDVNIGGNKWGQPGSYFHPYARGNRSIGALPPGGENGDYLTERLTSEAVKLMKQWKDQPFFMHLSYYAVHTPIQPKPELLKKYEALVKPSSRHSHPGYAAMVESVDQSLGKLRQHLVDLNIDDRTVIFLTSDNGGVIGRITDNFPLRSGKSNLYEGGVRVPTMIQWPGKSQSGTTCSEPVITVDFYPTILEIAGVPGDTAHNEDVDGLSLAPLLQDPAGKLNREAIYWHYPHYQAATPYGAVRSGPWRLIEFYEDMRIELYNLEDDIGETNDLSEKLPAQAAKLLRMLQSWRKEVGAQMPTRVENFSPTIRKQRS